MAAPYGYAGSILKVNLSSGKTERLPTAAYSDRFLGGRGMAAKLYHEQVTPEVHAFDPENQLVITTGPLAGFPGLAGSRWQVCARSPVTTPELFSYCNVGGTWGVHLKFAGYDGLVVEGKAEKPVYLLVENNRVSIRDASSLWGKGAIATRHSLKGELGNSAKVLAIGPAGENLVVFASLLADDDSCGSGGLGAVMGAKNLKAIVVRGDKRVTAAHPEKLAEITGFLRHLKMNQPWLLTGFLTGIPAKRKACWGCIRGCARGTYTVQDGTSGKFFCQSGNFYKRLSRKYYGQRVDDIAFKANNLCDEYGLDATVIEGMVKWLIKCREAGILNDTSTGLPLSKIGSLEFIESLITQVARREGFGAVFALGLARAAEETGPRSKELLEGQVSRAGEQMIYEPRMYMATALIYALEPRRAIQQLHSITKLTGQWLIWQAKGEGIMTTRVLRGIGDRFFGGEQAFDFSTYAGKALAVKKLQERDYIKESLVVCDSIWPLTEFEETEDHLGDPTLESRILSAVTGKEVSADELCFIGERIWNLQRAIWVREGQEKDRDTLPEFFFTVPLDTVFDNPDCLVPGKDGEVITRRGAVLDKTKFEEMKSEYYWLRGWDFATGLQTRAKLAELGLQDIIPDLEQRRLIV